MFTELVIRI